MKTVQEIDAAEKECGREYNEALQQFYKTGTCADRVRCSEAYGRLLDASRALRIAEGTIIPTPEAQP